MATAVNMVKEPRLSLFSRRLLQKKWGVIPSLTICSLGITICGSYVGYMCMTKPDISFRPGRWAESAPYQDVDPYHPPKMRKPIREYTVEPEIEALRREIGSYSRK